MRKLGIVVTFVFNNFQRKEIWRDTLKQSMRKSSILVTNVNINLQQTEVSRLILNHEWYLFWLPSILLFYLIKSGLQSQLRRFWAQQRQVHKYFRSVDPFQVFWFVQFNIKSVNEKVKYPCCICEKEFTAKGDVKIHIESVHEKVKYPFNQCEYKATVSLKVWRFT